MSQERSNQGIPPEIALPQSPTGVSEGDDIAKILEQLRTPGVIDKLPSLTLKQILAALVRDDRLAARYDELAEANKKLEERFEEALGDTRAIIHNLRGDLTIAGGHIQMMERYVKKMHEGHSETIRDMSQYYKLLNPKLPPFVGAEDKSRSDSGLQRSIDYSLRVMQERVMNAGEKITAAMVSWEAARIPQNEPLTVAGLLDSLIKENVELTEVNGVKITITPPNPADTSVRIFAERDKFLLGFDNLIGNAIDALEGCPDPEIEISWTRQADNKIRILIKDNGIGMSEEVRLKCLQPLFTTKVGTSQQGSGMGLSLAKKIIERDLQGKLVNIWSEEGVGTIFTIDLPLYSL